MSKADYVRSQGQSRPHHCHWPGCPLQVPPAMWGCRRHWFMLPHSLRSKIWKAYVPGQEITMTPSEEYLEVAEEVQAWIACFERQGQAAKSVGPAKERRVPKHTVRYRSATFGGLKVGSYFKASKKQETWWVKRSDIVASSSNGGTESSWQPEDLVWIDSTGTIGTGQSL